MLPKALENLIDALGALPGVGARTAERYALNTGIGGKDDFFNAVFFDTFYQLRYMKLFGSYTVYRAHRSAENMIGSPELLGTF